MKQVVVLGGGPAGMSCALWLKHLGLEPIVIEQAERLGGLPLTVPAPNPYVLGFHGGTSSELAKTWVRHMAMEEIPSFTRATITRAVALPQGYALELNGRSLEVAAVVLATGTRFRGKETLAHLPGFARADIHFGAPPLPDRLEHFVGKTVAVLGGGDNAYHTALVLSAVAKEVSLIMRGPSRAQAVSVARLPPNVRVEQRVLTSLQGLADVIVCQYGFTPVLHPLFPTDTDADGYIRTDGHGRTSLRWVYAAGDVMQPVHPCIPTAIAAGTVAARSIERDLRH